MSVYARTTAVVRGIEEYEVEIEFKVTFWGDPGRYSGPPEDCYPAEGPEFELVAHTIAAPAWAKGRYPQDSIPFALTDAEERAIYEDLLDNPPEPDEGPDPDDWRDQRIADEMSGRAMENDIDPFD